MSCKVLQWTTALSFECPWEEEHGLSIWFKNEAMEGIGDSLDIIYDKNGDWYKYENEQN